MGLKGSDNEAGGGETTCIVNGETRSDFAFRGVHVKVSGKCAEANSKAAEKAMRDKIERKLREMENLDLEAGTTHPFRASFVIGSSKRVVDFVYDGGFLRKYDLRDPQILMLMADGNQEISLCDLKYISEHLERIERCIAMHAMNMSLTNENDMLIGEDIELSGYDK